MTETSLLLTPKLSVKSAFIPSDTATTAFALLYEIVKSFFKTIDFAAQGIEFRGETGQERVIVLETAFNEVNVFGDIVFAAGLVRQEGFDHVLGDAGAHQAGEVGFDPVTQAAHPPPEPATVFSVR